MLVFRGKCLYIYGFSFMDYGDFMHVTQCGQHNPILFNASTTYIYIYLVPVVQARGEWSFGTVEVARGAWKYTKLIKRRVSYVYMQAIVWKDRVASYASGPWFSSVSNSVFSTAIKQSKQSAYLHVTFQTSSAKPRLLSLFLYPKLRESACCNMHKPSYL